MRNPHDEISIDDYDADDYDDRPQERDPRHADQRRNQHAPADLDPINSGGYDEPALELPKRNRAQRRVNERELRAKGFTPQHREANGVELLGIDFEGHTFWFPADPTDWKARATRAFEDGKAITAIEALLVPDEKGRTGYNLVEDMPMRKVNELFELFAKAGGFESSGN
jgi:hypothetical protein